MNSNHEIKLHSEIPEKNSSDHNHTSGSEFDIFSNTAIGDMPEESTDQNLHHEFTSQEFSVSGLQEDELPTTAHPEENLSENIPQDDELSATAHGSDDADHIDSSGEFEGFDNNPFDINGEFKAQLPDEDELLATAHDEEDDPHHEFLAEAEDLGSVDGSSHKDSRNKNRNLLIAGTVILAASILGVFLLSQDDLGVLGFSDEPEVVVGTSESALAEEDFDVEDESNTDSGDSSINHSNIEEVQKPSGHSASETKSQVIGRIVQMFDGLAEGTAVNQLTGEVLIRLENVSFDAGYAGLGKPMQRKLKKLIPRYAAAIFGDKELKKKIDSLEIVGFSSPTYSKKLLDPNRITKRNKVAVFYNLDLSYRRARSVYQFVFDKSRFRFPYQDAMFQKTRISGRGHLDAKINAKQKQSMFKYCKSEGCRNQQVVALRFYLKN